MSECRATAEAVAEHMEVDTGCPLCGKGPDSHHPEGAEARPTAAGPSTDKPEGEAQLDQDGSSDRGGFLTDPQKGES